MPAVPRVAIAERAFVYSAWYRRVAADKRRAPAFVISLEAVWGLTRCLVGRASRQMCRLEKRRWRTNNVRYASRFFVGFSLSLSVFLSFSVFVVEVSSLLWFERTGHLLYVGHVHGNLVRLAGSLIPTRLRLVKSLTCTYWAAPCGCNSKGSIRVRYKMRPGSPLGPVWLG